MSISIFGFSALWSPFFLAVLLLTAGAFFYASIQKKSEPLTRRQGMLFIAALIVLYFIKGSPIDVLGHIMMTYHMMQMAVLYLVVPPLLIKGIPSWMWNKAARFPGAKPVASFVTQPLIALILFNGLFSLYHIPLVFDFVKMNEALHSLYTVVLFFFSLCMWWPLVSEQTGKPGLHGLKKVGYIFANGILLTPACALIIFADGPLYQTYSSASAWLKAMELCVPSSTLAGLQLSGPELFSNMPILEDQRTGGIVMKIIQEVVYGIVLAQVFFEWVRKEEEEADELTKIAIAKQSKQMY